MLKYLILLLFLVDVVLLPELATSSTDFQGIDIMSCQCNCTSLNSDITILHTLNSSYPCNNDSCSEVYPADCNNGSTLITVINISITRTTTLNALTTTLVNLPINSTTNTQNLGSAEGIVIVFVTLFGIIFVSLVYRIARNKGYVP